MEEITKIPHATAFRTLKGLQYHGILKSVKLNKKDILYELVTSPRTKELKRVLYAEEAAARKIALQFVKKIKSKNIHSVLLYGSSAKRTMHPESDIDVLVIMKQHDPSLKNKILDIAGEFSSRINETIAVTIMSMKEFHKGGKSKFLQSIKSFNEVLYGKNPF